MTDRTVGELRSRAAPEVSLGSALFLSALVVIALAALAFWPSAAWSPPPRPALHAPIVLDEFVSGPSSPSASPSATP